MALTNEQIASQKKEAEELLFSGPEKAGFAKGLFFGHFNASLVFPYPEVRPEEQGPAARAVAEVRSFATEQIDAAAIDRNADIPPEVIAGLGRLGVMGMTAPEEYGGRGLSQLAYCKVMEVIGGHCSSTAVFVNAHQSIGIRALVLFGTEEQKKRWLPGLASGAQLAAFALTEAEAGSDAANVQTTATPTPDGKTYLLSGEKRYITNGGIAQVLTVMARTPSTGASAKGKGGITAFLVTPDLPGFQVVEARMPKCGIRGTATGKLAFHDVPVPAENVLGEVGRGLRIALTVLDFGRTTFGASCTGAAKTCLRAAVQYARTRVQFKQALSEFELIKKKIAWMSAHAFAMEAMTMQCAAFIDRGAEDYMLETAMLKVFTTEALWQIVNDTIQIFGGKAYFTDEPYERMMRDARINQIGEGANEVLKALLISPVGMRAVGEHLKGVLDASRHPIKRLGTLWRFGLSQITARLASPSVPVQDTSLRKDAGALARRVRDFGLAVYNALKQFRKTALKNHGGSGPADEEIAIAREVLKNQYVHERIADAACDLYASSCTLSRLDSLLAHGNHAPAEVSRDIQAGRYFLRLADRRIQQNLNSLTDNDDEATTQAANAALASFY